MENGAERQFVWLKNFKRLVFAMNIMILTSRPYAPRIAIMLLRYF